MDFQTKVLRDLNPSNLRYLLYLVTPNETTFETMDDIPNYIDMVGRKPLN